MFIPPSLRERVKFCVWVEWWGSSTVGKLGGGRGDQFRSPRYAFISKISLLLLIEAFQDFDSPPGGIGLSFVLGVC